MGMAASQARLLSITTRMSDNELRSQLINNQKMRLATESSQVSENYINALNEAQYMFTNYDADNKATYQQLTFNSMTAFNEYNNQYGVSNAAGQILVSETDGKRFEDADGDLATFLKAYGLEYKTTYFDELTNLYGTGPVKLDTVKNIDGTTTTNYSRYNAEEIQKIYEGDQDDGGIHAGYENSLMSTSYNDYLKLEDKYVDARENYYMIIEDVMREYADGITGEYNGHSISYKDLLTYTQGSADGNSIKNLYAFEALINKMEDQGKFNLDANYEYIDANGVSTYMSFPAYMQKLIDECKYTNNDTTQRSTVPVSYNGNVATIELDDDYVIEITKDTTANTYTTKVLSYDDTGALVEAPQSEDGDPNWKWITQPTANQTSGTIGFYEEGYDYGDNFQYTFTWGSDTASVTETLKNNYNQFVYFENLASLVDYFNDAMINAFNPEEFNSAAQNSGNYQQYYNDYVNAAGDLYEFIFGQGNRGQFDDYANLDDYKWCLDKGGTSQNYQSVADVKAIDEVFAIYGEPKYAYVKEGDGDANADAEAEWYTNLFNRMQDGGYKVIENGLASSAEWMRYALESGLIKMEQVDKNNKWSSITFTSCSDITEQTNDVAVTIAEAEYNKAMNKIENKDKVYDMELKNIDTEHTALQTEYDSIKSALDKNVERNFKLYS